MIYFSGFDNPSKKEHHDSGGSQMPKHRFETDNCSEPGCSCNHATVLPEHREMQRKMNAMRAMLGEEPIIRPLCKTAILRLSAPTILELREKNALPTKNGAGHWSRSKLALALNLNTDEVDKLVLEDHVLRSTNSAARKESPYQVTRESVKQLITRLVEGDPRLALEINDWTYRLLTGKLPRYSRDLEKGVFD